MAGWQQKTRVAPTALVVAGAETEDLDFTARRSRYRRLLDSLLDSPKGSVLKFEPWSGATKTSLNKHARDMEIRLAYAVKDAALYVKILPGAPEKPKGPLELLGVPKDPPASAPASALGTIELQIMGALSGGPLTVKELARNLGATPTGLALHLARLVGRRSIENDDGVYRRLK